MKRHGEITGDVVAEFRKRLAEARQRLFATVARTEEELATLEAHPPGGPGEDAPTEAAAAILNRLDDRERHELDEIDAAQARLEAGTFGVCEGCHRPILLARLRARPTARLCVPCQSREER